MKSFWNYLIAFGILSVNVKPSRTGKLDVILSLKEYFKSKVILFVNDESSGNNLIKFYKNEKIPFVGIVDLKRNSCSNTPLTPFRNSLLIIDTQEKFLKQLTHIQDLTTNVMSSVIWVTFVIQDVREKISNVRIPFDCLFLMIRERIRDLGYEISEIYETAENKPKLVSHFGWWKNGTLKLKEKDSYYSRTDLHGHRFNISVSIFPEKKEDHERLWRSFSEKMNFSINWISHNITGQLHPNGSKTGIFKMIEDRDLDGTPSNFAILHSRLDNFDFIWPTVLSDTKIYVAVNREINWNSFIAPFSWKVWLAVTMSIILISIAMHLVVHLKGYRSPNKYESFFDALKAISYQGGKVQSTCISYYISYILPYMLAIVVVQHYSGALHSFLTVKNGELPFENLEGVVKHGKYKVTVVNVSYASFYINTDKSKQAEKIRNELLLPPEEQPLNTTSGFHQLCKSQRVFFAVTLGFKIQENCDIQELSEPIFRHSLGIMVWKGFPYKNIMTKIMKRLQFAGLVKWNDKNIIINNQNGEHYEPLPLRSIFPIFLFLGAFTFASLLIFVCEILAVL